MVRSCYASPEPRRSLEWVCRYYETYSRSQKEKGEPVPRVSEDTLRIVREEFFPSELQEQVDEGKVDKRKMEKYFEQRRNRKDALIAYQAGMNLQLAFFGPLLN